MRSFLVIWIVTNQIDWVRLRYIIRIVLGEGKLSCSSRRWHLSYLLDLHILISRWPRFVHITSCWFTWVCICCRKRWSLYSWWALKRRNRRLEALALILLSQSAWKNTFSFVIKLHIVDYTPSKLSCPLTINCHSILYISKLKRAHLVCF